MKEQILNKEEPLSSQDPKKIIYVEMFRARSTDQLYWAKNGLYRE
jgi:hypothetical protein